MQPIIEGKPPLGCQYLGASRARFLVWGPRCEKLEVHLPQTPARTIEMKPVGEGYFAATVDEVEPGTRYYIRVDGEHDRPDPASRFQPMGVHGPSEVVARQAEVVARQAEVVAREPPETEDDAPSWPGIPLRDYIIYELHPGTFSAEGTFEGAIDRLDELVELGITAVELMPVAAFPGDRNWGYDGVQPFAVHEAYGGPDGLKRFVRACHRRGLAVVLDVVYNHLGPEGNYLHDFGPYFTDKYRTPWGDAVNFDGPESDHVRRYFLQNAAQWFDEFRVDALRLDAVHAIFDDTPVTFLEELRAVAEERSVRLGRPAYLLAETHANDPALIRRPEVGGVGMHAHWSDDFHHAVHTLLTGESQDYYCDYGDIEHLAGCIRDGYSYTGQYSPYRKRRHGQPPTGLTGEHFVVCIQNHDQVGNRPYGKRLSELVCFEQLKLAAAALLCSPFVPLLFMGEEYAERAPFPYFISHGDPDLIEAVRQGRKAEFRSLEQQTVEQGDEPPDPAAEQTFLSAKLDHRLKDGGRHQTMWNLYRELIALRKSHPALCHLDRDQLEVTTFHAARTVMVRRWYADRQVLILANFGDTTADLEPQLPPAIWQKRLETCAEQWAGPGATVDEQLDSTQPSTVSLGLSAHSAVVFDASKD